MSERVEQRKRMTPEQKWQVFLEASRRGATDAEVCCRWGITRGQLRVIMPADPHEGRHVAIIGARKEEISRAKEEWRTEVYGGLGVVRSTWEFHRFPQGSGD